MFRIANPFRVLRARRLAGAFARMVADPRYAAGLAWGEPRPGHPEGSVRAHIADLEANLVRLAPRLDGEDTLWKLRLLVHAHDTFKSVAVSGIPIRDPRSHASLARAFLAGFVRDRDVLEVAQYHDIGYSLWLRARHDAAGAAGRFDRFVREMRAWDLFLAFAILDGCTAGKEAEALRWVVDQVRARRHTRVDASWILPPG